MRLLLGIIGALAIVAGVVVAVTVDARSGSDPAPPVLSARPGSYLGLYADGVPASYSGLTSFSRATGVRPDLALYYSGWYEPFRTSFAEAAAWHGAVPLVQVDPTGISLAAIAAGRYDSYLHTFAAAVRSYGHPVVLGFGHEVNAPWYSWGHGHTSAADFVAAWRHLVGLFAAAGASNVTWMWTVNAVIPGRGQIASPAAWWPGRRYVDWVGIDAYYLRASTQFDSLFGPTIAAVRAFTQDPILISETGASPAAGQPAKIAGLFAGIRAYALLGFVWFDSVGSADYLITSPAAIASIRAGARNYHGLPAAPR